jgi:hypothetical protein
MLWFALLKVVIKQANIVLRIIVPFKLQWNMFSITKILYFQLFEVGVLNRM